MASQNSVFRGGPEFGPNREGAFDLVFENTTTTADNVIDVAATFSGNQTSGYNNVFYVNLTVSGSMTGGVAGGQVNAFGADITLDGSSDAFGYGGGYIYIAKSGSWSNTSAVVYGFCTDIQEVGQVDYLVNLWLQNSSTNASTGLNAYILFSNQGASGGKNTTLFYVQGITLPKFFLQAASAASNGFISARTMEAATSGNSLTCYLGSTTYYIPLYSAT
jgi:hypothetical protein